MENHKKKLLSPRHLKTMSVAGIIFMLIPVSIFAIWIYSANKGSTQADSVAIFNSYFPSFLQGRFDTTILSIGFCITAIFFSIRGLKLEGKLWYTINLIIIIISSLLLFLNLFSMM